MDWSRLLRHAMTSRRATHGFFAGDTLAHLQRVIADGEATHRGEVRLIVESAMPLRKVARGLGPRQRALDLFGTFRVWDTEENNGVLLYINVADRRVEVIADRAVARKVDDAEWRAICAEAGRAFATGAYRDGTVAALDAIEKALAAAFPPDGGERRNELSDAPVVL